MILSPQVGVKGVYNVLPPFALESSVYECTKIITVTALIKSGVNVYDTYFRPYQLSELEYKNYLDNNYRIVTLVGEGGDEVTLPEFYISLIPLEGNILYGNIGLLVNLGELPIDTPLDILIQIIHDQVVDVIGVLPVVKKLGLDRFKYLTSEDANLRSIKRKLLKGKYETNYGTIRSYQARLAASEQRCKALEELLTR